MRLVSAVIMLIALAQAVSAEPTPLERFQSRVATEAITPQGAARLWFDAVFLYQSGNTQLGTQCLTSCMANKDWQTATPLLLDTMRLRPYLLRSYVKGATPEAGYRVNTAAYELDLRDLSLQPFPQFPSGKVVRLVLHSGGADAPRPLDLERNTLGQYAVRNCSALLAAIRPPVPQ